MKLLFLFLFAVLSQIGAKILIEKWEVQVDPKDAEVKRNVRDKMYITVDATSHIEADDVVIEAAAYSKVDGTYNPFVKPDPIHICKVHEHEDPLVQYMHEEILKFGNVTKACPLKKGYYYIHDFIIDEAKFPMPLPEGEFRLDINASVSEGGTLRHVYSSELYFKTVKD